MTECFECFDGICCGDCDCCGGMPGFPDADPGCTSDGCIYARTVTATAIYGGWEHRGRCALSTNLEES